MINVEAITGIHTSIAMGWGGRVIKMQKMTCLQTVRLISLGSGLEATYVLSGVIEVALNFQTISGQVVPRYAFPP